MTSATNRLLPPQMSHFPPTRFMGSKYAILSQIWAVARQFPHASVLDLFSGSGAVSYMFKTQGKAVLSNDYMAFCADAAAALVANDYETLSASDVAILTDPDTATDGFVSETFRGLYFSDEDNAFIDTVRANIAGIECPAKLALARTALVRACLKKRPRGIFTYTGHRYDDGRRDLQLTLAEHFTEAVGLLNAAVFANGKTHDSRFGDAFSYPLTADLVYIDPPYYSPLSDNEYVRRYHFVEGIARDWTGVSIQSHTITKKFQSYPTPFRSRAGAYNALEQLFLQHQASILLISYSSNAQPSRSELVALLSEYKNRVESVAIDHRYHFGNHGHLPERPNNKVQEYLFVGYD